MDTLKNIDINIVKIGQTQATEFINLKNKIERLEINQNTINQNIEKLEKKLDIITALLKKNSQ